MKSLSWTPKRQGSLYCSPACGSQCLWTDFQFAKREARKIADRLGRGWKPVVWENLGWHYKAVSACGRFKVHGGKAPDRFYMAFLGEAGSLGGVWAESGPTPASAVNTTLKVARKHIAKLQSYVDGLEPLRSKG